MKQDKLTKAFFAIELLVLLVVAFIATNTYATISCTQSTSCSDTEVLFVENDNGGYYNAHAQNVSVGTYAYSICCNAESIGQSVGNSCDDSGAATFLKLSATNNAHVEVPSFNNYSVDACISVTNRILSCEYEIGSCSAGSYCIASIASSEMSDDNLSNAHVDASCNEYETKICCSYSATPPVMQTARISPNTTVYTNDTLKGYCKASDADLDSLVYHYNWYVNDSIDNSGTSGLSAENVENNVDDLSSSLTTKHELWIIECKADDGTFNSSYMNSSTVTILNHVPNKVSLNYPVNADTNFYNLTPRYTWSAPIDIDGDSLTYHIEVSTSSNFADQIENQTGISTTHFDATDELPSFTTYFWRVRANDGEGYGPWSDTWNFTLGTYLSVYLIEENMTFGNVEVTQINDTTNNNPQPFVFESASNTYADLINVSVTDPLWDSVALGTDYWRLKARSAGNDGSFNESGSNTSWVNIPSQMLNFIDHLNYSAGKNRVSVDMGIEVPFAEGIGTKTGELYFVWEVFT